MSENLKNFYQQQRDQLQTAKTESQLTLSETQETLIDARNKHADCTRALAELEQAIAANRQAMAQVLMPSDVEELADELRELIVQHRAKQRALIDAEQALDAAERAKSKAAAELSRTTTRLGQAEVDLAEAETQLARFQAWQAALSQAPLSTLATDAQGVLGGNDFSAARTRVEADIPTELRTRAVERRQQQLVRLAALNDAATETEDLLAARREEDQGIAQQVARLWTEYRRTETAFGDYVQRAKERYDRALALLGRINGSIPLTTAETDRITDPDLVIAGKAAVDLERDRDAALVAVEDKQAELNTKERELLKADIDTDLDADMDVQNLKEALATLQSALTDDETAYTETMRGDLDAWEGSVPEHIWANLDAFARAESLLNDLASADPNALATAVTAAETTLVTALEAQAKSIRTLDYLQAETEQARQKLKFADKVRQRRLLSVTRGDGQ